MVGRILSFSGQNFHELLAESFSDYIAKEESQETEICKFLEDKVHPLLADLESIPSFYSNPKMDNSGVGEEDHQPILVRLPCMLLHNSLEPDYFRLQGNAAGLFGKGFSLGPNSPLSNPSWVVLNRYQVVQIPHLSEWATDYSWNGSNEPFLIVKSFHDLKDYQVCNLVEFVGFLEKDPISGAATLHSLYHRPISANLPPISPSSIIELQLDEKCREFKDLTLRYINSFCHGDSLLAEMVLLHLISKLNFVQPGLAESLKIGQWSFNLILGPGKADFNWAKHFHERISSIAPKAAYFSMDLQNLNEGPLCSVMDYENSLIKQGFVQLSPGTHLILDETALTDGQVNERGIRNLQILRDLIDHQTVPYEFSYEISLSTDIPVIVVSEGPSMFRLPNSLTFEPEINHNHEFTENESEVKEKLMGDIRSYLYHVKNLDLQFSEQTSEILEKKFLDQRSLNEKFSPQDFSKILEIYRLKSRLVASLEGFDESVWTESMKFYQKWQDRNSSIKANKEVDKEASFLK